MDTKKCNTCDKIQDKLLYTRCSTSRDGLVNKCKDCVRQERETWNKLVTNCEFCNVLIKFNLLKKHVKRHHWADLTVKNN